MALFKRTVVYRSLGLVQVGASLRFPACLGQAEIRRLDFAAWRTQDVLGFQVEVQDAVFMNIRQSAGDFIQQRGRLRNRPRPALHHRPQRRSFHEFGYEQAQLVAGDEVMDGENIGMRERCQEPGFAFKVEGSRAAPRRPNDFDRHGALEAELAGSVNDPSAAFADLFKQFIARDERNRLGDFQRSALMAWRQLAAPALGVAGMRSTGHVLVGRSPRSRPVGWSDSIPSRASIVQKWASAKWPTNAITSFSSPETD